MIKQSLVLAVSTALLGAFGGTFAQERSGSGSGSMGAAQTGGSVTSPSTPIPRGAHSRISGNADPAGRPAPAVAAEPMARPVATERLERPADPVVRSTATERISEPVRPV